MKNSLRKNKLWEGHRLYYPEMRELVLEGQKEKVNKPEMSEDILEQFHQKLLYAINFNRPVIVRYYSCDQIQECIIFSFKIDQGVMICENGKKLGCLDIVEVEVC